MGRPYPFKRKPYSHQVAALKKALKLKNAALLMEPRTGKTKVSIDYLSALHMAGRIDRAVIIAPARVLDVWVQAFRDDCPTTYSLYVWDARARRKPLPPIAHGALNVILVNYEAFATPGKKLPSGNRSRTSGRFKHRETLERWLDGQPAACILDESHKIKNPQSKAAVMIVSMRGYFDYRLILTGTPVTKAKRVFDLYMQWKFLNPARFADLSTAEHFRQHYGVWFQTNAGYAELKKLRNIEELNERIYQDAYRVTRDECFDLPEKSVRIIPVELSDSTGRAYDELAKEMVAQIEREDRAHVVQASIPLVLTLRLTQVTGGFVKTEEERDGDGTLIHPAEVLAVGTEKLDILEGLLEETAENDEKIVVAARFKPEMDAIAALAEKLRLPVWKGGVVLAGDVVTDGIQEFKEHNGAGVMVIQPQAGGVGIDLSTASHMVWYSLTSSWVDYTQACDRIALSKKATTYTYL